MLANSMVVERRLAKVLLDVGVPMQFQKSVVFDLLIVWDAGLVNVKWECVGYIATSFADHGSSLICPAVT